MFSYKKSAVIIIFLMAAYFIWNTVKPTKIVRVNHGAIFAENLPITTDGKLKWWLQNKEWLQQKYHIITTPYNFTVVIMKFNGYEPLPKGTRDGSVDDYTCLNDNDGNYDKCVYNNIAIIVRGNLNGKQFINIGQQTYIQTSDGKVALQ